jgi:uncharacterized protein YgbK (DUF1537 family)
VITVVLDDDPTGTQAVRDVSVVLDWSDPAVWGAVRGDDRAVHVLTNTRAHGAVEAAEIVTSAALAARIRFPRARIVLRGDSTLRAHVYEEYEALRAVVAPGRADVPLLLVPALPAAGRITVGGVHLLERDGERIPLDRTEYARSGLFAYADAHLGRYAEERSGGRLAASDATFVPLAEVRSASGANAVAAALARAAELGRPAVVAPDAETLEDLRTIARGLVEAEAEGTTAIVRSAPAFVAELAGSAARTLVPPPEAGRGVLVVCGSYVPTSTAQVEALERAWPGTVVGVRVAALAGDGAEAEVGRAVAEASVRIAASGLAAVVTDREHDASLGDPASQRRIAAALARIARRVEADVLIAKGGITSHVTALEGRGARSARVIGPVVAGVVLWRLPDGSAYLVVPGNVGGPGLIVDVVEAVAPGPWQPRADAVR